MQKDPDTGLPTAEVAGIGFTLQEAEKNSAGIYEAKSGAAPYTYATGDDGSFVIPYTVGEGESTRVVLERGKSYLLTEGSVESYNTAAAANKNQLVPPDKSWVLTVPASGVATVAVNGTASQTPEATVAPAIPSNPTATPPVEGHSARFVLWNQIVVEARLIPLKVQKTWISGEHRDPVAFTVYGVSGSERYPLTAYSSCTVSSSQLNNHRLKRSMI